MSVLYYVRVVAVCLFIVAGIQWAINVGYQLDYLDFHHLDKEFPYIEQVHVTYLTPTEAVVTWSTHISPDQCELVTPSTRVVLERHSHKLHGYHIFKAPLTTDFNQEVPYTITCSADEHISSKSFSFHTHPGFGDNVRMLILADWATCEVTDDKNPLHTKVPKPNVLDVLLAEDIPYWSIWHIGDFAYDLYSKSGQRGNMFMNSIEPLAATQPYMAIVGNHEIKPFFKEFYRRFANPLYYSFEVGKATIIAVNAEFDKYYYYNETYPMSQVYYHYLMEEQLQWMKAELSTIDRTRTPWVIAMLHKTLYSSPNAYSDMITRVQTEQEPYVRKRFETLFVDYQVDLVLSGHLHLYERTLPIKYDQVDPGASAEQHVFTNPSAPIYIVNGVAGNIESTLSVMNVTDTPAHFSAFISEPLGYGFLTIANSTHLVYEQYAFGESQWDDLSTDFLATKRLIDHVTLVRSDT